MTTTGSTWPMWAYDRTLRDRREYQNIGEHWWVKIHGLPDPVVPVTVTEVELDSPEGTHWGWIDADGRDGGKPVMIWAHRGAFDMQFPYGPKIEEEHGKGRVVRLRITADRAALIRHLHEDHGGYPAGHDFVLVSTADIVREHRSKHGTDDESEG